MDTFDEEVLALYDKWHLRVRGYLIRLGTDRDLAVEFTDDAFLATRRYWEVVRGYASPQAYVFKVATNLRSRYHQRHARLADILLADSVALADKRSDGRRTDDEVAQRLELEAALLRLPSRERESVMLRFMYDLSVKDTADILGVAVGTIKASTHTGLARLRHLLDDGQQGEEPSDE